MEKGREGKKRGCLGRDLYGTLTEFLLLFTQISDLSVIPLHTHIHSLRSAFPACLIVAVCYCFVVKLCMCKLGPCFHSPTLTSVNHSHSSCFLFSFFLATRHNYVHIGIGLVLDFLLPNSY